MDKAEHPRSGPSEIPEEIHGGVLETLLQEVPVGVLVTPVHGGRPAFANREMERIWKRPLGGGLSAAASREGFHADGQPLGPNDWPVQRVLSDGRPIEDEIEIVRGDGTRGIVQVRAAPVRNGAGEMLAVVETWLDISEQRRRFSSRKFLSDAGSLLSSSVDYLSTLRHLARLAVPTLADWCTIDLFDRDGTIERVAVEHIDRRKAAAAAELARRYPPNMEADIGVGSAIRNGRSELYPDVTPELLRRLARSRAHLKLFRELGMSSAMVVPLVASGKKLGAISFVSAESRRRFTFDDLEVAEDLAARAALAIENSRLFNESRAATEAKSDFLAVMSHELRTPLTAIIGYAELLQLGVPDPVTPRQHEQAERIEASARHLLQLIEEILTLVTLDSGEIRIRREEMRVNDLLRHAASIIGPMAKSKDLPLEIVLAKNDPVLRSDPDKLLQILLNLLSNAVKFTEAGEIALRARRDGDAVVFEVADTGIGLGNQHLKEIFKPFWQVERPITRRGGGTGLGLTISRRLADLLGADISVDSKVGEGSSFKLRVPLSSAESVPPEASAT